MNAENYRKTNYNHPFIEQRADPYILHAPDGSFYFTASVPAYDKIVLRHSRTLEGLAASVPCYQLDCLPDEAAARLCQSTIAP